MANEWKNVGRIQGEKGDTGEKGDKPEHQWNGTNLRFQNPNGDWGSYTDLRGERGLQGIQGVKGDDGDPATIPSAVFNGTGVDASGYIKFGNFGILHVTTFKINTVVGGHLRNRLNFPSGFRFFNSDYAVQITLTGVATTYKDVQQVTVYRSSKNTSYVELDAYSVTGQSISEVIVDVVLMGRIQV